MGVSLFIGMLGDAVSVSKASRFACVRSVLQRSSSIEAKTLYGNVECSADAYRDAEAFRALAPKTAKDYGRILSTIGRMFGDCPLKLLHDRRTRSDFLQWRDDIARTSPRTADYTFAVFARALSWASDRGLISLNPLERHGRVWKGSRSESVWTDADEARLLAVASPPMALAFMLALWTGQRQGDLLRLTWGAYDAGSFD